MPVSDPVTIISHYHVHCLLYGLINPSPVSHVPIGNNARHGRRKTVLYIVSNINYIEKQRNAYHPIY